MKKFSVLALALFAAFAFASCGSLPVNTADVKNMAKDTAVKEGKAAAEKEAAKISCQKDCDKTAEDCTTKAGKSKAKAKKCETAKTKCYAKCDPDAKPAAEEKKPAAKKKGAK